MKHLIQSMLLAVLSLSLPSFGSDETHASTKAAQAIVVPNVTFVHATIQEVISFLTIKSKALDPKKQGVNIALASATDSTKTIDLQLSNATVLDILRASAGQVGMELQPADTAILLVVKAR